MKAELNHNKAFFNQKVNYPIKTNAFSTNIPSLSNIHKDSVSFTSNISSTVIPFDSLLSKSTKFDKSTMDINSYKTALMASKGIPVESGFVIPSNTISNNQISDELLSKINDSVKDIEQKTSKNLGISNNPLILSVKKGNSNVYVGLNTNIVNKLRENANTVNNEKFILDSYLHSISAFGTNIFGINPEKFATSYENTIRQNGVNDLNNLSTEVLDQVIDRYKTVIKEETGKEFPEDVHEQLKIAIQTKPDRKLDYPTIIQSKTFRANDNDSITGVCFSRDPQTGENKFSGDYIENSTGKDLLEGKTRLKELDNLAQSMPAVYEKLTKYVKEIEKIFYRPQSIGFNIENGELKILSTQNLHETAKANIKITVDMHTEGLLNDRQAISRVKLEDLDDSLTTKFKPDQKEKAITEGKLLTAGTGVSPGASYGKVVFDTEKARDLLKAGEKIILIKNDTNAEDIEVMTNKNTAGIIAINAGPSSHAAVIARGIAKPCIVSCQNLKINTNNTATVGNKTINEGDSISIDGETGEIFAGKIKTIPSEPSKEFFEVLDIADKFAAIQVLANAETPQDVELAKKMGAKGIGLCRTEHMFFGAERTPVMQRAIIASSDTERQVPLRQLEQMQYNDFKQIFESMADKPVTIRLLDPPLNEFLPKSKDLRAEIERLREKINHPSFKDLLTDNGHGKDYKDLQDKRDLLKKVEELEESNPMMGRRGSRLGIVVPELYSMQVKSIVKAAIDTNTKPEIMIPMISDANELEFIVNSLKNTVKEVLTEKFGAGSEEVEKRLKDFKFGTMIELPRAALIAGDLAKHADFFSFGTNDLTQMTYGFSRDDAQKGFLIKYLDAGILKKNPFESIDIEGVGKLIKEAITEGRKTKPDLKIGVCGEQGGDPNSINFLKQSGVNYVSCSPPRIPKVRLVAGKKGLKQPAFTGNFLNKIKDTINNTQAQFTKVNPETSQSFRALKEVLDREFANSLNNISKEGSLDAQEVKAELRREYGQATADALDISGNNVGFNNLVLMIPGIYRDGTVPDLFPVTNPSADFTPMGGGHWSAELRIIEDLIPVIKRQHSDFSFEKMRENLNMDPINKNKALPAGASLPTKGNGNCFISRQFTPDAFDHKGNPNYASIHGSVVYDGNDNNYLVLDSKPGIKQFVEKNQQHFDNLTQKFNIKGVIVGGEPVIENQKLKEKNDLINQMRGELYMTGVNATEFSAGKNPKEVSTTDLIELLTNPVSNKKYLETLHN